MLTAREIRVCRQNEIIINGKGLVCFTMNIPGPYKNSPTIEKAFNEGIAKIEQMLLWNDIAVKEFDKYVEKTGCEAYFLTDCDPCKLKKLMVQIEDSFVLGRLYDIDVINCDKEKVSRTDIGYTQRKCFICGKEGAACARSRAHTVEQLQQHIITAICHFFNEECADAVSENAVKALLYEVSVTPKPGLVDRLDNGAHEDMDFFSFINSSCSLQSYFKACAIKGIELCGETPQRVFQELRYLGRLAQEKMYSQTMGINTHKGAIFSLGIISAAIGFLNGNGRKKTVDNILTICAQMAKLSMEDFEDIKAPQTFGEKLFCDFKLTGVRGQAADGFPAVKSIAYPVLSHHIRMGDGFNKAGMMALVHLIAEVCDTNIIKRSSVATLEKIQGKAKAILADCDNVNIETSLENLNREFIELNVSPGGCADLLSLAFMLYFSIEQ